MNTTAEILAGFSNCKAAIVGDFTLDFYITTDPDSGEISIETGLPTHPVRDYRTSPGGAGNVALNLAVLGVEKVSAFGVTGSDMFGSELLKILSENNIDISGMVIQNENWNTHVYTKIIDKDIERNRLDFGNFNSLSKESADKIISNLEKIIQETDILVINQQLNSGVHSSYFIKQLTKLINSNPDTLCISDSRDFPEIYNGTCRKINRSEAEKVLERKGIIIPESKDKDSLTALELYKMWNKPVFLTRGEMGLLVCDNMECREIPGILIQTEVDTVGAGDTTLAAISAVLGSGFSSYEAAVLGNKAASITVKKLHTTGTATPEEIEAAEKELVYVYNPLLAGNAGYASYWKNTEIEIVNTVKSGWNYRFALFDHDGTISTLRQGWEEVMAPMMMEAVIGKAVISSELYNKILYRVNDYIDKTTGIQTLIQMKGLTDLIREFNLVPEDKILNEFEYKKIFNDRLMMHVNKRTQKFTDGELNIHDVTIKNAVLFLEKLNKRGMKIFLTSGTDEEDVKREAKLLGYDHYFTGGIFGATMDIKNEPKRTVINNIIEIIGRKNADQIITFGDGPVEIAETRKAGGVTVGIASNEVRRYSINTNKRSRLIKAGADIIIPDYSQMDKLFNLLEGKGVNKNE